MESIILGSVNVFLGREISVESLYSGLRTFLTAAVVIIWVTYICSGMLGSLVLPYCYVPVFGLPAAFSLIISFGRKRWKITLLSAIVLISSIGPFWILGLGLNFLSSLVKHLGVNDGLLRWIDKFLTPTPG